MDKHVKQFFCEYSDESTHGNFNRVIALHERSDIPWEEVVNLVPSMIRGWYELSCLNIEDRIEFTSQYWLKKLPYHPHIDGFIDSFFSVVEDVGIYLTQKKYDDPFEANMVYGLKDDRGFYRGCLPAIENEILELEREFPEFILPEDYLSFLQIHNGFWKTTDSTGLINSHLMKPNYTLFQQALEKKGIPKTTVGKNVNPHSLIPFYESFGMPFYQCFWGEWHPESEMGNIYYSGSTNTITDVGKRGDPETLAFDTFTDWLMFYLEQID